MAPRTASPPLAQAIDRHLRRRRNVKDARNEVSLLAGPPSGRIVGKKPAAPALSPALGHIPCHRLTSDELADWEYERSGQLSHNRQRANRFILRGLLKFCIAEGWLPKTMLQDFPALKKQHVRREWLRPRQVAFLMNIARAVLDDYLYFAIYTYLQTGVRAAELPTLRTNDLQVAEKRLSVIGKGSGDGKPRPVPVSEAYAKAWQAHIRRYAIPPGAHMFFSRRPRLSGGAAREWEWQIDYQTPASPQVFRHLFDDPKVEAGKGRGKLTQAILAAQRSGKVAAEDLPHCKISPLVLRRTFACLALIQNERDRKAGLSLARLERAMGHSDPATTRLYLSDVEDYLAIGQANFDLMDAVDVAIAQERRAAG
jgi:integrase